MLNFLKQIEEYFSGKRKVFNLKVIGSCGGEKKGKRIVESYGFDHAIDHRTLPKRTGEVGNYDWTLRKEELKKRSCCQNALPLLLCSETEI